MDEQVREQAEAILEYRFKDPSILESALTHASVADCRLASNERMEFFGDSVLGMVVCEYLYHRYPDYLEGDLTKIKSAAVSRRSCANVARALGLDALLVTGKGMGGPCDLPRSLSAAVLETLVAAIYLDGGLEPARDFILRHLSEPIESAANSGHHENFKSVLQQHAQRRYGHSATYVLLDEKGPDHAKCFEVCVEIDGRRFPSCWCPSKKQAEQRAALNALLEMGVARIDEETEEPYLVAEEETADRLSGPAAT
ncbi:MAG: ribonuclease III [Phycisphaerales bacterium]|nr:ribonuclease III [Phycisphaerales bacterium]